MMEMSPEEREYAARAERDAWSLAVKLVDPVVQMASS
jgi:hypothetical protein